MDRREIPRAIGKVKREGRYLPISVRLQEHERPGVMRRLLPRTLNRDLRGAKNAASRPSSRSSCPGLWRVGRSALPIGSLRKYLAASQPATSAYARDRGTDKVGFPGGFRMQTPYSLVTATSPHASNWRERRPRAFRAGSAPRRLPEATVHSPKGRTPDGLDRFSVGPTRPCAIYDYLKT